MVRRISADGDESSNQEVVDGESSAPTRLMSRSPVHVVYGGAHLYSAETPVKLGKLALQCIARYAPNFVEFAHAMNLPGTESLPRTAAAVAPLAARIQKAPERAKEENFTSWFAWSVYERTLAKLRAEPVEDFRIDFEDGYGFRSDAEEDSHAVSAALQLAKAIDTRTVTAFSGFRIKSLGDETRGRSMRTLDIFLTTLFSETQNGLPSRFAVTLPKVTCRKQVRDLCRMLAGHEKKAGLPKGTIDVEIMIETPDALLDGKGRVPLRSFIAAAGQRRTSAHFGAYDYTASLSIAGPFQDIRHPACDHARNIMQGALSPLGVRLADSVTTQLPVPIHHGDDLSASQANENRRAVHTGWTRHFENINHSMAAGFYQSWDLHPHQLPARYAAVYSFYLYHYADQAERFANFMRKATQAVLTGNTFDDAASAEGVLNFFRRAVNCRALTDTEILTATGLASSDLMSLSFSQLVSRQAEG